MLTASAVKQNQRKHNYCIADLQFFTREHAGFLNFTHSNAPEQNFGQTVISSIRE